MKLYMKKIFKRIEDGIFVRSDSEQMALEIKNLEVRIAGLDELVAYYRDIREQQALTIHIHEKGADEQAARVRMLRRRIEELETSWDRRTRQVRDAALRTLAPHASAGEAAL